MNRKKTIIAAIVLALILLIGSLLAYFTDVDTATNKFTLGDEIDIEVVEDSGWTFDSNENKMTNSNAIGLHPGTSVTKEPSIKNKSTTTPAYVFAEVTVPCYASTGTTVDTPLYTLGNIGSGWTLIKTNAIDTTNKTITYVYAYGTSSSMTSLAKNTTTSTPVFGTVSVPSTLTAAQAKTAPANPDVVVVGRGIQTDGLGTATTPTAIYALL